MLSSDLEKAADIAAAVRDWMEIYGWQRVEVVSTEYRKDGSYTVPLLRAVEYWLDREAWPNGPPE